MHYKFILSMVLFVIFCSLTSTPTDPDSIIFTPPEGWHLAENTALPPSVKVMVVGKGEREFPPSINLSVEPYSGTQKQYLKIVKSINDAKGAEWKDLGNIRTQAGNASLSQVDSKSEWGDIRMMHVILVKNKQTYILTAASLKDEFSKYYKDFFAAMRSLRFEKEPPKAVENSNQETVANTK